MEGSFSKPKLIKFYLKSMSQERLNGLIKKENFEEIEYKKLITNFASQKPKK